MASSWGGKPHALYFFFQSQHNWRKVLTKFAKPKIVSPTAMAKLAIASTSLEFLVINREIFIPKREIGRFSLFDQKSGDLPPNRETWKLCNNPGSKCSPWCLMGPICSTCVHSQIHQHYVQKVVTIGPAV